MKRISDLILKTNYPIKRRWLAEFSDVINIDEPDITMLLATECIDSCMIRGILIGTLLGFGLAASVYIFLREKNTYFSEKVKGGNSV